jgi:hypothetical protein
MKLATVLLSLLAAIRLSAQEGYEIKVTLKPFTNQYIYLGHYFGKQLPIIDSVKLNEKSEGVFKGPKKLGAGIYMIGYPDRAHNFEILVGKNQKFSVLADTVTIAKKITYINSTENNEFVAYQAFMIQNGKAIDSMQKRFAMRTKDSVQLRKDIEARSNIIKKYREDIIAKDPDGLLATLLKGMREPEIPKPLAGQKQDSLFAYRYFKNHYWDGVRFYDDRIVRTPFFEARVDKYFEQLVYPDADSVIKEIDWMLGYASASEEMQRFLLLKFVNRYLNQKYMWEDKVFVHLFEKYFAQKKYAWMADKGEKTIRDRAYSLMANIFGSPAADVELPDSTGKIKKLYDVKAPYTLLVIWDPKCSHCKEVLPRLDTLFNTKWKAMGLKLYAVAKETDGTKKDWTTFINQYGLGSWAHVYYSKDADKKRTDAGIPSYSQLFDVQSFPTLYLLDGDKRIIAKKISEQQVDEILAYKQKTAGK